MQTGRRTQTDAHRRTRTHRRTQTDAHRQMLTERRTQTDTYRHIHRQTVGLYGCGKREGKEKRTLLLRGSERGKRRGAFRIRDRKIGKSGGC